MIAARDGNHSNDENRLDEEFAGHQAGHTELGVVERELRVRGKKRALAKLRFNIGKTGREARQCSKQAVVGEDTVDGEPYLRAPPDAIKRAFCSSR